MFLRYEDAAMRPLKIYQKLSKFSGIRESEMVKDWLGRNTRVADAHKENDEYSTSRNSTATVNSWRRRMPYALVAEVQSQCAEIMNILRYLPARNERELMDVAKSLVSYDKTR
jgi:nitroreductase